MESGTLISLIGYFILMLAIGLYAYRAASASATGYLLGGRQLGPTVTALSAGASDMSGWMVMGLPGAMYLFGMSNIWIAIGLVMGAYANYLIVAPRLRVYTELANNAITLPQFFEERFADKTRWLRVVSALVIIVFFTVYTSSGIVGGGKLFESSFGLSYELGLYVTAGVVVIYTLFGGFLAVSITDFVQGCIMFIALILVPIVIWFDFPSYAALQDTIVTFSPEHIDIFAGTSGLAIFSALAWGLGYFGQPHIIVRFMAIRSVQDLKLARRIGMSWMIVTLVGAMATGYFGYAYVQANGIELQDAETIFVVLSSLLFHPLISGFLLAAILAAIMSTVSSQLLVTSSSLAEDIYQTFSKQAASERQVVLISRCCVVAVAIVAIIMAHDRESSILNIVANAWAGFGAAFGPLIIFGLYWKRMTLAGALAGILVGTLTILVWFYGPLTINGQGLNAYVYGIIPGVILSSLAIVVASLLDQPPSQSMRQLFESMQSQMRKVAH